MRVGYLNAGQRSDSSALEELVAQRTIECVELADDGHKFQEEEEERGRAAHVVGVVPLVCVAVPPANERCALAVARMPCV